MDAEIHGENMSLRKRTEVVVETHRTMVIRQSRHQAHAWCAECARLVDMITAAEAATVLGLSQRVLFRQIEVGQLHFKETDEGPLLICADSLVRCSGKE